MTQHQRAMVNPVKAKKSLVGNCELSGKYFRPRLANSTDSGIYYRLIQETEDFIMAMCGCPDCTGVDVLEDLQAGAASADNCDLFRARIAELEGELECEREAARDGNAEYLELQSERDSLRTELAALKAQEPVGFADITLRSFAKYKSAMQCLPLYSAPVSEAKARDQASANSAAKMPCGTAVSNVYEAYDAGMKAAKARGVVMLDEREAFEKWGETLFYVACFERHGNDEYAGRGLQGAWLGWQARARLNASPVQQVSVPGGWKLVPVEATDAMVQAGTDEPLAGESDEDAPDDYRAVYRAMLAAAPAAPAADAGLVYCFECREIGEGDWVACDYDRYLYCQNSPEMDTRVVLAAHRSTGVV
jgi:hypothetical protein